LDKRKAFLKLRERYRRRGKEFVYVDESGFAPSAAKTHGYAPKGQRIYGLRSGHSRPRTSLLAAKVGKTLTATMLFKGTCNTTVFNAWLEKFLLPLLDKTKVVVMDNAIFHKSQKTRHLIEQTGATLLFLPPYSPDLNPIENTFGTLKRYRQFHPNLSLEELIQACH
jgi:transposase